MMKQSTETEAKPPVKKQFMLPMLTPAMSTEQRRNGIYISVPPGVTLERLLQPDCWTHSRGSNLLRPGTLIELVSEAGDFDALVRINAVSFGCPELRLLFAWRPEGQATESAEKATTRRLPRSQK